MLSPQREGRLTASDHATALGLNPYCSRQELWRRWNGLSEPHDEQTLARFAWGHEHECDALACYEAETGELPSHTLDRQIFVPYEDWSGCTPDGFVGEKGLVEFKCPQKLWEVPPEYYWLQCQSQLAITERKWCDLTAWTEDETAIWRTERSPAYWEWSKPLLMDAWKVLIGGLEPKRSKKPKIPTEVLWTRIA